MYELKVTWFRGFCRISGLTGVQYASHTHSSSNICGLFNDRKVKELPYSYFHLGGLRHIGDFRKTIVSEGMISSGLPCAFWGLVARL